jgi:hypothetical protein
MGCIKDNMEYSRDQFVDEKGRYKTLSLFLEIGYNEDALFTLKGYDHEYGGKVYPSLKKLFLEASDPTEYKFATTYLADWDHWQKICANKVLALHVEKWRYELELKLRAEGVERVLKSARSKGNWLAAKFLAEKGWETRAAGRPSKAIQSEFEDDIVRLRAVNG